MAQETNAPRTHTLVAPVTLTRKRAGEEVKEEISVLHFRKPVGADFRAMDNAEGALGKAMELAAAIADVPVLVIERLEGEDYFAVLEIAQGFLPASLQTGATSKAT